MNLEYLLEDDLYEISEESVKGIIKKGYALLLDLLTRIFHKLEEIKRNGNIKRAIQNIYKNVNKVSLDERFDYIVAISNHKALFNFNKNNSGGTEAARDCIARIIFNMIIKFKKEDQLKSLTTVYDSIKQKDWNSLNDDYINDVMTELNDLIHTGVTRETAELSLPDGTSGTMEKCIKLWFNCISLMLRKVLRFYRSNKDQWCMNEAQKNMLKAINVLRTDCNSAMAILRNFGNMTR